LPYIEATPEKLCPPVDPIEALAFRQELPLDALPVAAWA
jgi:hypothetical protein